MTFVTLTCRIGLRFSDRRNRPIGKADYRCISPSSSGFHHGHGAGRGAELFHRVADVGCGSSPGRGSALGDLLARQPLGEAAAFDEQREPVPQRLVLLGQNRDGLALASIFPLLPWDRD